MYVEQEQANLKRIEKKCAYFWFFVLVCYYLPLLRTLLSLPASICTISMLEKRGIFTENASESLTLVLCSSLIQDRMMDPRHRQLPGSKDHLQLRQQVKAYLPFFWLLPFLISTHKYFYNVNIYQKSVDFLLKMLIVNY